MTRSAVSCAGFLPHPDSNAISTQAPLMQGSDHRVSSTGRLSCLLCLRTYDPLPSNPALRRRVRTADPCCRVCARGRRKRTATTFVIVNARIADGTGAPLRNANVRVAGDRIAAVGSFEPQPNEPVLDAKGRVLAPGFIDIHNHSDDELAEQPLAESQIAQGITSCRAGSRRRLALAHRRLAGRAPPQPAGPEPGDDGRTRHGPRARHEGRLPPRRSPGRESRRWRSSSSKA